MNNVGKYSLLPTLLHISIAKRAAKAVESTQILKLGERLAGNRLRAVGGFSGAFNDVAIEAFCASLGM